MAVTSSKRGRKEESTGPEEIVRISELRFDGKNWEQIAKALYPQFGLVAPGTYKKFSQRYLPIVLLLLRRLFLPFIPEDAFLPRALSTFKGHAGRPKKIGT